MGMTLYRNIIAGVRIEMSKFSAPWYSDKYLPYIEGHPGISLCMVWDHENKHVYVGYLRLHFDDILTPEEKNSKGGGFVIKPPTTEEELGIGRDIENAFGLKPSDYGNQPIKLWMIGVWM